MLPFDNNFCVIHIPVRKQQSPRMLRGKKQMGNECRVLKMIEEASKVVVRVPAGKTSTKPNEQAKKASTEAKKVTDKSTTSPMKPSKPKTGSVAKRCRNLHLKCTRTWSNNYKQELARRQPYH
jgi:hypothetical protein